MRRKTELKQKILAFGLVTSILWSAICGQGNIICVEAEDRLAAEVVDDEATTEMLLTEDTETEEETEETTEEITTEEFPVIELPEVREVIAGEQIEVICQGEEATVPLYQFVPQTDGIYQFYSIGEVVARGCVYNEAMDLLAEAIGGETTADFKLEIELQAGEMYYLTCEPVEEIAGAIRFVIEQENLEMIVENPAADMAVTASGKLSDTMTWKIVNGVLRISTIAEKEAMPDYSWTNPWHQYASTIKEIVIGKGITQIGACAFYQCNSVRKVTLPDTLVKIGHSAFYGCSVLESVSLPVGIEEISSRAFEETYLKAYYLSGNNKRYTARDGVLYNKAMTEIKFFPKGKEGTYVVPSTIRGIGSGMLKNASISQLIIPASVVNIDYRAFFECKKLTAVTINAKEMSIGSQAFYHCSALKTVKINSGAVSIGSGTFAECNELSAVDGMGKVIEMEDRAFFNCPIKNITLSKQVSDIPNSCFSGNTAVTSVSIPDGVKTIGDSAFYNCTNLKTIRFSMNLEDVAGNAFKNTQWYKDQKGTLLYAGMVLCGYKGAMPANTQIVVKSGTTAISSNAFYGCTALKQIEIPSSVKKIGDNALGEREQYTNIVINPDFVIIADKGSAGEQYAKEYGYVWKERTKYNIQYKLNGGQNVSGNPSTYIKKGGTIVLKKPTRKGYKFVGWYTDAACTKRITQIANGRVGDLVLYAKWTDKTIVSMIVLNKTQVVMLKGQSVKLNALVTPSDANVKTVTWSSSNTKVATVNSVGKVQAVAYGDAVITCTAKDGSGVKATCTIKVRNSTTKVTKITLNKTKVVLKPGNTITLKPTIIPNDSGDKTVIWKSSDANVARVDSRGVVTAKRIGTATITCIAGDNSGIKATCTISVQKYIGAEGYVARIYTKALGREPETGGLQYWTQEINAKRKTPVQVAEAFFFAPEFTNKKLNNTEYVKVLYRTFMGREADQGGLNYWVGRLNKGESRRSILEAFAGCDEFKKIVKSFGL